MGRTPFHHLLLRLLWVLLPTVMAAFTPRDNYLIDCGSATNTTVHSRTFVPDEPTATRAATWALKPSKTTTVTTTSDHVSTFPTGALLRTARVFPTESSYTFPVTSQGRHFLRLHFLPFVTPDLKLTAAKFSVNADGFTLISDYHAANSSDHAIREYLLPSPASGTLVLSFQPSPNSFAFVNAIELFSAPDSLFTGTAINPGIQLSMLNSSAYQTAYRVNMGGPSLSPENDTLYRSWTTDGSFLVEPKAAQNVSYPKTVEYQKGEGPTPETAPEMVYRTAVEMSRAEVALNQNFNVTWSFNVDPSYAYLTRLHFCDIVSNVSGGLLFNVYVGGSSVFPTGLDLSDLTYRRPAVPYFFDFVVSVPDASDKLRVSIGPVFSDRVQANAILNGIELLKLNNSLGSLSGLESPPPTGSTGKPRDRKFWIALAGSGAGVVLGVALCFIAWCRNRKKRDVATKPLPAPIPPPSQSKEWTALMAAGSIHSAINGAAFANGTADPVGPGNGSFPLAALAEATNGFDEVMVIGVGGFGKVYRGVLRDGTPVAVKRGNRASAQGIHEFRTEIELLSQLRHRHLVSLIGFCNEGSELILVYEYMERGALKGHLYGADEPPLSWRQRLEICIGAARGLHYLHTGQTKPIIHRDVKSANILLDSELRAKVADFGLSKTGPDLDKTHVSTAVKGSFGYLDPEYFRRQRLTEKSDVYSFGVVLLEVLCSRPVIDPSLPREMVNLAEWAMGLHRRGRLDQAVDPLVRNTAKATSLANFVETIEKCLADEGSRRPAMGDVLWNLEFALQLQDAREEGSLNGDDSSCDDAAEHSRDSSPLVRDLRSSELDGSTVMAAFGGDGDGDLRGLSMSKVFSQLVKAEGRN